MSYSSQNYLILQNNKLYKEIMFFNPVTEEKKVVARSNDKIKLNGTYEENNNHLIMLYKKNNLLYFRVDRQEFCLDNKDCVVHFKRDETKNFFSVTVSGSVVFEISYRTWRLDPINLVDPNFNDDIEEFQDIYLFVYNLLQEDSRRKEIYSE